MKIIQIIPFIPTKEYRKERLGLLEKYNCSTGDDRLALGCCIRNLNGESQLRRVVVSIGREKKMIVYHPSSVIGRRLEDLLLPAIINL